MQEETQKGNGEKIAELSNIIHNSQSSIETLFEELEELTEKFEIKKQELDSKLAELNEIVKTWTWPGRQRCQEPAERVGG